MNQESERTVLAAEIMTESVITVPRNATVQEVAQLMLTNRIGSIVVTDENGDFAGMITERMMLPTQVMVPFMRGETLRLLGKEVGSIDNIEETMDEVRMIEVSQVMNAGAPVATKETAISKVAELMVDQEVHHVCVLDGRKPVGIISRHDLMRIFFE